MEHFFELTPYLDAESDKEKLYSTPKREKWKKEKEKECYCYRCAIIFALYIYMYNYASADRSIGFVKRYVTWTRNQKRRRQKRKKGRKEGERIPFNFVRWTVTLRSEIGRLIAWIKLASSENNV